MAVAYVDTLPSTSPVPGVRTQLASSPPLPPLGPADEVGLIGTSDRGVPYVPVYVADRDFASVFGGKTLNVNGSGQLLTLRPDFEGVIAQGVQDVACQRVIDSTGRTAYITISAGATALFSLHASSPGTWANGMAGSIQNIDTTNQTFDMTITNGLYGQADVLRKIPYGTTNAAMLAAINTGIPTVSPAAKLVKATAPVTDLPVVGAMTKNLAAGGTLPAGAYRAIVSQYGPNSTIPGPLGFTMGIELGPVTIALGDTLTFSSTLQLGAAGFFVGLTPVNGPSGSEAFGGTSTNGGSVTITAIPTPGVTQNPYATTLYNVAGGTGAPTTTVWAWPLTGAARAAGVSPGANGDNPTTAQHIGAQGLPDTGIYRMGAVIPPLQIVALCGPAATDTTGWDECARVARANNWQAVVSLPLGTSDAAAIAALTTPAMLTLRGMKHADYFKIAYGGLLWYERSILGADILTPAQADFAGITAATPANTAAGNKPLGRGDDTESTISDETRLTALWSVGANPLINNIPAGGFGFMRDTMFSGRESFEMRLIMLLVDDMNAALGQYAQKPNDPDLWASAQNVCLARMNARAAQGIFPENPEGGFTGATGIGAGTGGSQAATSPTTTGKTKGAGGSTLPSAVTAGTATATQGGTGYSVECSARTNIVNGQITDRLRIEVRFKPTPNTVGVDLRIEAGVGIADITPISAAA